MRIKLLVIVFTSILFLSACSDEGNNPDTVDAGDDTEEVGEDVREDGGEDVKEETTDENTTDLGKRSNPVPLGESVQIPVDIYESADSFESEEGLFEVSITNLISGDEAFDFIKSENQFNEEAPEGYQWIVLDVSGTLVEGSEDSPYTPTPFVSTVSESGEETPDLGIYATIDNEFGWNDLFHGGTTNGKIAILAPADEDYLIKWDEGFINSIFFDNK